MANPPEREVHEEVFRWQSVFQRTDEALFVLNRGRRLVFANRAFEALTGLNARENRRLVCKRRARDGLAGWIEHVQAALAPPAEVLDGRPAECRRLLPAMPGHPGPRWWHVSFFPLMSSATFQGAVGKIAAVAGEGLFANPPIPEKIMALRDGLARCFQPESLASDVPAMLRVAEQVRLAATTRIPVLLTGEVGAGKHWIARVIHLQGADRDKPFVRIHCGRLPKQVVEGMFGSTSVLGVGAGTVYLSEVAELPREIQAHLCRWMAGEGQAGPRVLAGMAASPEDAVQGERLLPELHCLLSPLTIKVPALRERIVDMMRLVQALLARAGEAAEHSVTGLSDDALDVLRGHSWPHNLGELYQVLVGACARAKTERIEVGDMPYYLRSGPTESDRVLPLDSLVEQVERRLIVLALRMAQNNKSRAAELLSIWRPRLLRRIEVLGIE